jgi:CBS domain-containing protein
MQMKVRDVMTADVVTASPDTTLEEISTMMKTNDTGAIPVVDEEELVGIITDRDIVVRCVAEGKDPAETTAEDIITNDLETVDPDTDVEEALDIMGRNQVRRLPVVEDGTLVGMISIGDLAVKQDDEQDTGETLKSVSRGVKQGRKAPPQASRRAVARDTAAEENENDDSATTGITNNLEEEEDRQERVVNMRPDATSAPRTQKKPSKRKAS